LIAIPELEGKYAFGDFSLGFQTPGGRLFYGDLDTGLIQEFMIGLDDCALGLFVKGFGQDADGELYVLADLSLGANSNLGEVLKIVAPPVPIPAAVWLFGWHSARSSFHVVPGLRRLKRNKTLSLKGACPQPRPLPYPSPARRILPALTNYCHGK
jgi:hypothetical protein